jgi:hypothetical protein
MDRFIRPTLKGLPENGSDFDRFRWGPVKIRIVESKHDLNGQGTGLTLWRWAQRGIVVSETGLAGKCGLSLWWSEYDVNLWKHPVIG